MENSLCRSRPTKLWALPFLMLFFIVIGQIAVVVPMLELGIVSPESIDQYPFIVLFLLGPFSVSAFCVYMWITYFEREKLKNLGVTSITLENLVKGAMFAILMGSVSVALITLFDGYIVESSVGFSLSSLLPVILLAIGFCIQASVEEFIFRGWIMHRIITLKGVKWGVWGNATLFTFMHLMGFDFENSSFENLIIFCVMLMMFAIFLSLVTIRTRNIGWACGWHITWNWLFINVFGLPTTGISLDTPPLFIDLMANPQLPAWLTGNLDGPENSIVTLFVFSIAIFVVSRKLKKSET